MKTLRTCAVLFLAPILLGAAPAATDDDVRVLSYNILADHWGPGWEQRREAVNRFLQEGDFDIMALQEVTERQVSDIATSHPGFDYIVGERSDGHRGDQPWYEFNPIFFDADHFRLIDHSSFWVSETPWRAGSILPGTKDHARVLTWARLEDRQTGKRVLVANVHIHGLRGADEVRIILDQLASQHRGEPLLLLGDFNFTPGSPGYLEVDRLMPTLRDAAAETGRSEGGTLIGPDGSTLDGTPSGAKPREVGNGSRIDYIFVCGFRRLTDYRVTPLLINNGPLFASDHHPVSTIVGQAGSCRS